MRINHDYSKVLRHGTYEDRRINGYYHRYQSKGSGLAALLAIAFLIILALLAGCTPDGWASESDDTILRCGIGEAASEGSEGLHAVYSGILNRIDLMGYEKALAGVYGCQAGFVHKEPAWVFSMAKNALRMAQVKRLHDGTHWESTDFKKPYWADKMIEVVKVGKHIFYK